ncbi:MAG: hypothetical protein K6G24_04535 [Lachnospiraceae bacterium]|nr:hypothetical protein [Lachnospiraceae bacterium]
MKRINRKSATKGKSFCFGLILVLAFTMAFATACSKDEPSNEPTGQPTVTIGPEENKPDSVSPAVTEEPGKADADNNQGEGGAAGATTAPVGEDVDNDGKQSGDNKEKGYGNLPDNKEPSGGSDIDNPPATGEAEITPALGADVDNNIRAKNYYELVMENLVTGFSGNDDKAVEVAFNFCKGYIYGDKKMIKENLAFENEEVVDDELEGFEGIYNYLDLFDMGEAEVKREQLDQVLSVEAIGGQKLDKEKFLETSDLSENYIEDDAAWDNYQLVSVKFTGVLAHQMQNYMGGGINNIVAEKNGEYKVIWLEIVDFEADEEELIDEYSNLLNDKKYKFTGSETKEDLLKLYINGLEEFDFFKVFSTLAMDNDKELYFFHDNYNMYEIFEIYRLLRNENIYIKCISQSEAKEVDADELESIKSYYEFVDDFDSIEDIVKFDVTLDMKEGEYNEQKDIEVYVGKLNGEYRVFDSYLFG